MTSPNPVTSTIVGSVLFVVGYCAVRFGLMGLELALKIVGDYSIYLLAGPLLLFVAYLVGNGYLEYKQSTGPKIKGG